MVREMAQKLRTLVALTEGPGSQQLHPTHFLL